MSETRITAAHSQLAPSTLAVAISDAYGLAGQTRLTLLRSWTNDVYALTSEDADFVLKVYRATWRRPSDVRWEVDLQDWLASHGAPVASVIRLADGDLFGTLRAPEGVRCFAIFQRAPGSKPSPPWSARLYEEYGRGTALLHEASTGFSHPQRRFGRTLEQLLDGSLMEIGPWLNDRPDDMETVRCVAERVRRYLTPLVPDFNWGVCHGDVSLDNLHVLPDGRIMLYDLDSSCYGWRAWDVCNALGYALPELQDAFLRGYRTFRPFSVEEMASVRYFMAADILRMMADEIGRWSAWFGTARVEAWVDDKLTWLHEWERDHCA